MQAALGCVLVVVGAMALVASIRVRERAFDAAAGTEHAAPLAALRDRSSELLVVAAGVAVYYAMRQLGRGVPGVGTLGLALGIGIIVANNAVYTVRRFRTLRALKLPAHVAAPFERWVWMHAAGNWVMMAGCWLYLTRP
jgi:hypothetical protein